MITNLALMRQAPEGWVYRIQVVRQLWPRVFDEMQRKAYEAVQKVVTSLMNQPIRLDWSGCVSTEDAFGIDRMLNAALPPGTRKINTGLTVAGLEEMGFDLSEAWPQDALVWCSGLLCQVNKYARILNGTLRLRWSLRAPALNPYA